MWQATRLPYDARVQTQSEIKELLAARGISPKHRFGQNFLVDHNLLRRLVDASGIGEGSLVLEIGPGTGTMSEEILARGAELIAIELDRDMAAILRERLSANPRFTLIEGDCLDGKRALNADALARIAGRTFTLVANLPYQAASPVWRSARRSQPVVASSSRFSVKSVIDCAHNQEPASTGR